MQSILLLILASVISYLIGTINFSKIIAWRAKKKDITELGSKNPGAMNMLRQFGFGIALLTFIAEVVKAGLTCLAFKLIYSHFGVWGGGDFVYYLAGLSLLLGNNFPIWSKFKGGKGVSCLSGIFLFSPIWYVGLGWFVLCFLLFLIIDIGSVISLTFIGGLTIATTVFAWCVFDYVGWLAIYITVMVWVMYAIIIIQHRENIARLIHGKEGRVGLKSKLKKMFSHGKGERICEEGDTTIEKEIVIEENTPDNDNNTNDENREN